MWAATCLARVPAGWKRKSTPLVTIRYVLIVPGQSYRTLSLLGVMKACNQSQVIIYERWDWDRMKFTVNNLLVASIACKNSFLHFSSVKLYFSQKELYSNIWCSRYEKLLKLYMYDMYVWIFLLLRNALFPVKITVAVSGIWKWSIFLLSRDIFKMAI